MVDYDTGDDAKRLAGQRDGVLGWMARNHVAANILMAVLLGGGIFASFFIRQEVFPVYDLDIVSFRMPYPGASPEEVEQGIILAVEEHVRGLDVVKRMTATAEEGVASVSIELVDGADPNRALQDIRNAIDRIPFFPEEAENYLLELAIRMRYVIRLVVAGDVDEFTLYEFVQSVREDLLAMPEISRVDFRGRRAPEISIEVPQATLRAMGLTLRDIASVIRQSALDVPAGGIRTEAGEVLLRTTERRFYASGFNDIPIVSMNDGTKVPLEAIATIREGFEEETESELYFNGKRALGLAVFQVGDERPLDIVRAVRAYIDERQESLPAGISITAIRDHSVSYRDRMTLLLRNGAMGLVLVLILLGLFLNPRLAFWVALGIPISIIGSLLLLPLANASINMVSLFAFIVTLGIVVDDAVIVGENIFHKIEQGMPRLDAAIAGTKEMTVSVLFAVITNIVAFVPLLFVPGMTGQFFGALPAVIIAVFVISLVECLFILPAHLGHGRRLAEDRAHRGPLWLLQFTQRAFSSGFDWVARRLYQPLLRLSLHHRYLTLSVFTAGLAVIWAWYDSGRLDFNFMPQITEDRVDCNVLLPYGASFDETIRISASIEQAGMRAVERVGGPGLMVGVERWVGRHGPNSSDVNITLIPQSERDITPAEFTHIWREEVGDLPGIESLFFEFVVGPGTQRLTIELSHPDPDILERAATDLAAQLALYEGVTEIDDGFTAGKPQIDFTIRPEGRSVGLTPDFIGRQIRDAFFGAEALRQQRGRDEVRVMVRLPRNERQSLLYLEEFIVQSPDGTELPLAQAVDLRSGRAYTEINRVDARRVLNVSGDVIPELANADRIRIDLTENFLPELTAQYAGLSHSFEGRHREQVDALGSLFNGLLVAMLVIYCLLAALFRSYAQGLLVMTSVPFGIGGGLVGHVVMGYDLSVLSIFGLIAVSGVVVNGALVLTLTLNKAASLGTPFPEAVEQAAFRRFRPILLTSLTTFIGLVPIIFETSVQARFLVPMAISLGYGILFSTAVILIFVPALHRVVDDLRRLIQPDPVTPPKAKAPAPLPSAASKPSRVHSEVGVG